MLGATRSLLVFGAVMGITMAAACGGNDGEFENCQSRDCCTEDCNPTGTGAGGTTTTGGSGVELVALANYGDNGKQLGQNVAFAPDGSFYVTGMYQGSLSIDDHSLTSTLPEVHDQFLIKYSPEGVPVWVHGFGQGGIDPNRTSSVAVAVGPDGHPVVGGPVAGMTDVGGQAIAQSGNEPDLFVAKLDQADGTTLWVNHFAQNTAEGYVRDIAIDAQGAVYFTGNIHGASSELPDGTTTAMDHAVYVAKLGADGAPAYSRALQSESVVDIPYGIGVGPNGSVAIGGLLYSSITANDVTIMTDARASDAFVWTFDEAGAPQVAMQWGDGAAQIAYDVEVDSQGNIILCGTNSGTLSFDADTTLVAAVTDAFVAKVTPAGDLVWAKNISGPNTRTAHGVAVGPDDSVAVVGMFDTDFELGTLKVQSLGNRDIFVVMLTRDGDTDWAEFIGGPGFQDGFGVAAAGDGAVAFTGAMTGEVIDGDFALMHAGGDEDIIVGLLVP